MRKTSVKFLEYEKEIYQRLKETEISFLKYLRDEELSTFKISDVVAKSNISKSMVTRIVSILYATMILDKKYEIIKSEKNQRDYLTEMYSINLFTKKIFEVIIEKSS